MSSVSEVSVTIVFFSCFVTDGFCCVLQSGIVSEGWDGVCTNPQVQYMPAYPHPLPLPPPTPPTNLRTNRLAPTLHSPCLLHTLLSPHLLCSLSVIPFVLQCVLVSFCCELIVLLLPGRQLDTSGPQRKLQLVHFPYWHNIK